MKTANLIVKIYFMLKERYLKKKQFEKIPKNTTSATGTNIQI